MILFIQVCRNHRTALRICHEKCPFPTNHGTHPSAGPSGVLPQNRLQTAGPTAPSFSSMQLHLTGPFPAQSLCTVRHPDQPVPPDSRSVRFAVLFPEEFPALIRPLSIPAAYQSLSIPAAFLQMLQKDSHQDSSLFVPADPRHHLPEPEACSPANPAANPAAKHQGTQADSLQAKSPAQKLLEKQTRSRGSLGSRLRKDFRI